MMELIKMFCDLIWTMLTTCFSIYKQIGGIKNDLFASILGISPIVVTISVIVINRVRSLLRYN